MDDNKLILSGVCPYCPAVLDYAEDARAVVCHSCGNTVPTGLLKPLNFAKNDNEKKESDRRIAESVTSATTGIIYFDNYCESYDWREFALNCDLSIPMLDSLAEACKVKFSADPLTYYLDFRCTVIPITKKIEGIEVLEVEIVHNYKVDDISDLFEYVDIYSNITKSIARNRAQIIKKLEKDIDLACKFGADEHIMNDLLMTFDVFKKKLREVKVVHSLEDIPEYIEAKALKDAELAEKIREKGINAEKTYQIALDLLAKGNADNALHLLCAIHGYKDSDKYIAECTKVFKFNEELVELADKYYYVRKTPAVFDVNNPIENIGETLQLYEIENAVPSPVPALTQVSDIIHSFGSKVFFLRNNISLCCYDTKSEDLYANVLVLDEGTTGDYVIDHPKPVYYSSDKTKFFIRKKLREVPEKRGCFGRKKKMQPTINRANNYSIVLVDMDNVNCRTIIPEVVDVMDYYDDKIFYTTVDGDDKSAPVFRVYNIVTGETTDILGSDCMIHNVAHGKIIFSRWAPSRYNMDLYTIDFERKEPILIDQNIRDYYTTYGKRIFYTVGTEDYCRLYSSSFDGKSKTEIMENPGRVCTLNSGWLYYVNGNGANACLLKASMDGTKNQLVASRFGKFVKMTNEFIYYLSTNGDLKVVRTDGNCDTRIAANVSSDSRIIVDDNNIYYLKKDYLGARDGDANGYGYSLYQTDLRGKNLKKIAHDVTNIEEYNDKYIYICKKRGVRYAIKAPIDKKTSRSSIVTHILTHYECFEKATGEFEEILRLGEPQARTITYTKYFWPFTKQITERSTVSEIESNYSHSRTDVARIGKVRAEEVELDLRVQDALMAEKLAKRENKRKKTEAKKAKKVAKKAEKAAKKEEKRATEAERLNELSNDNITDGGADSNYKQPYAADDTYDGDDE